MRLDGERAEGVRLVINWVFPDLGRTCVLNLEHSALTCLADRRSEAADATVTLERAVLNRLVLREMAFGEAVAGGLVAIDGDADKVARLFTLLDDSRSCSRSSSQSGSALGDDRLLKRPGRGRAEGSRRGVLPVR